MNLEIRINSPIFIIGVGRSGTTLLQSMLNAHRQISFPPETHFFRCYISNSIITKRFANKGLKSLKSIIVNDKNLLKLNLDLKEIINNLVDRNSFTLENFYKKLLSEYAKVKAKKIIGDKDPKNIENLRDIERFFPEASILHIIRDPRDVVLSRMEAEWSKNRNFLLHILAYREQLNMGRMEGKKLFKNRYYEVIYEDLIEKPEEELKKITKFLGIEYDNNMLNYSQRAEEIIIGEESEWKANCFKPVLSFNKNKWKSQLSKNKVCLIEKICREPFINLNYKESNYFNNISIFNKFIINLIAFPFPLLDFIYNVYHNLKDMFNEFYRRRIKKV